MGDNTVVGTDEGFSELRVQGQGKEASETTWGLRDLMDKVKRHASGAKKDLTKWANSVTGVIDAVDEIAGIAGGESRRRRRSSSLQVGANASDTSDQKDEHRGGDVEPDDQGQTKEELEVVAAATATIRNLHDL